MALSDDKLAIIKNNVTQEAQDLFGKYQAQYIEGRTAIEIEINEKIEKLLDDLEFNVAPFITAFNQEEPAVTSKTLLSLQAKLKEMANVIRGTIATIENPAAKVIFREAVHAAVDICCDCSIKEGILVNKMLEKKPI